MKNESRFLKNLYRLTGASGSGGSCSGDGIRAFRAFPARARSGGTGDHSGSRGGGSRTLAAREAGIPGATGRSTASEFSHTARRAGVALACDRAGDRHLAWRLRRRATRPDTYGCRRLTAAIRTAPELSIGLNAKDSAGQLQIRWDGNSPTVRQATHAILEIDDGLFPGDPVGRAAPESRHFRLCPPERTS